MKEEKRRRFEVNGLEKLNLNRDDAGFFWFATLQNIERENLVELTIEAENEEQLTHQQLELINEFIGNIELVEETVLQYLEKALKGGKWGKSKTELAKMYHLTAITLKRSQDWWVVLEPNFNVETIFNFFPRFTIRDYEIEWSNV